jgi:hypothetical protein
MFKSETKPVNPGQTTDFFDFAALIGPSGGRVVMDKLFVVINGTLTVATALWDGRDVCRLMQLVTVEKRDGRIRWNLSGYKSRQASIYFNGIEEHIEHANVAIGAGQTIAERLLIPLRKRFVRRPSDFALPADAFKKITIAWASLTAAATGTTVLSAATLNAYILVEWHEEHKVEFKVDDTVKSVDFNSTTQAKISLTGALHDLFVTKEDTTAGGAATLNTITDARIEDFGTPVLTFADLVDSYSRKRQVTNSGFAGTPANERYLDPIRSNQVLPVMVADAQTSPWDGRLADSIKLDVGTGLAGASVVTREVLNKSQADYQATISRFGVNPKSIGMATPEGGTRPLGAHSKRAQLAGTWVAPLNNSAS